MSSRFIQRWESTPQSLQKLTLTFCSPDACIVMRATCKALRRFADQDWVLQLYQERRYCHLLLTISPNQTTYLKVHLLLMRRLPTNLKALTAAVAHFPKIIIEMVQQRPLPFHALVLESLLNAAAQHGSMPMIRLLTRTIASEEPNRLMTALSQALYRSSEVLKHQVLIDSVRGCGNPTAEAWTQGEGRQIGRRLNPPILD